MLVDTTASELIPGRSPRRLSSASPSDLYLFLIIFDCSRPHVASHSRLAFSNSRIMLHSTHMPITRKSLPMLCFNYNSTTPLLNMCPNVYKVHKT